MTLHWMGETSKEAESLLKEITLLFEQLQITYWLMCNLIGN